MIFHFCKKAGRRWDTAQIYAKHTDGLLVINDQNRRWNNYAKRFLPNFCFGCLVTKIVLDGTFRSRSTITHFQFGDKHNESTTSNFTNLEHEKRCMATISVFFYKSKIHSARNGFRYLSCIRTSLVLSKNIIRQNNDSVSTKFFVGKNVWPEFWFYLLKFCWYHTSWMIGGSTNDWWHILILFTTYNIIPQFVQNYFVFKKWSWLWIVDGTWIYDLLICKIIENNLLITIVVWLTCKNSERSHRQIGGGANIWFS